MLKIKCVPMKLKTIETGREHFMNEKLLMIKLADVMLQEKLITPDEKVKLLRLLKEGGTP